MTRLDRFSDSLSITLLYHSVCQLKQKKRKKKKTNNEWDLHYYKHSLTLFSHKKINQRREDEDCHRAMDRDTFTVQFCHLPRIFSISVFSSRWHHYYFNWHINVGLLARSHHTFIQFNSCLMFTQATTTTSHFSCINGEKSVFALLAWLLLM